MKTSLQWPTLRYKQKEKIGITQIPEIIWLPDAFVTSLAPQHFCVLSAVLMPLIFFFFVFVEQF